MLKDTLKIMYLGLRKSTDGDNAEPIPKMFSQNIIIF